MKNLKFLLFIFTFFVLSPVFAELKISGTITVAEPVLKNTGEDESWISYFVQGQLISDFQKYSTLPVIDRASAYQVLGEQAISEQNAFLSGKGEEAAINYASAVKAD